MNGVLLLDKPTNMTSHDVVSRIRKRFRTKKVGHAGTLDPFATGLLVLCLGQATRIVQYLVDRDKEYVAVMKLGESTDTQDCTGQIQERKEIPELAEQDILHLFEMFTGQISQTPPMFSARRVNGKRLYELARAGKTVQREARAVTIHDLEILDMPLPFLRFRVVCSKGTYIRTLAHDIGQNLHCGAHLTELRRTRSGQWAVKAAYTLTQLEHIANQEEREQCLLSLNEALSFLPSMTVHEPALTRLGHGTKILLPPSENEQVLYDPQQPVRVCNSGGKCRALARITPATQANETIHWLQPVNVFT